MFLTWLTWSGYVLVAPVLAAAISGVYFVVSPRTQPLRSRILASAHGATIALLYAAAWMVLISGQSSLWLGNLFAFSLLLPLSLIIISFFFYQGPKSVHWLQVINVACLLWTGVTGIMLVTGESF